MHTGVFVDIDFAQTGKFQSLVRIPHSIDRSPYYQVTTPICRIKNGEGPSILLLGGNHGDEYEGPIALTKFYQAIDPSMVQGEITILPVLNASAVENNRRCSALDGGNLNRSFSGLPPKGPTEKIADFLSNELFPKHDVAFDFHSGGTSMEHLACSLIEVFPDPEVNARACDMLAAMELPYAFVADNGVDAPTSLGAARRAGAIGISGEFGGCATATPRTLADTQRALDNVLMHLGICEDRVCSDPAPARVETQFLKLDGQDLFVYATRQGWYEPMASIGDTVTAGQPAAKLYDLFNPDAPPQELHFKSRGVVIARRLYCHTRIGDCLFTLGRQS